MDFFSAGIELQRAADSHRNVLLKEQAIQFEDCVMMLGGLPNEALDYVHSVVTDSRNSALPSLAELFVSVSSEFRKLNESQRVKLLEALAEFGLFDSRESNQYSAADLIARNYPEGVVLALFDRWIGSAIPQTRRIARFGCEILIGKVDTSLHGRRVAKQLRDRVD